MLKGEIANPMYSFGSAKDISNNWVEKYVGRLSFKSNESIRLILEESTVKLNIKHVYATPTFCCFLNNSVCLDKLFLQYSHCTVSLTN